jgi:nucleoside-diphosphate-sugar epimerase
MIFVLGGLGLVGSAYARYCARTGRPYEVVDRHNYAEYVGRACDILVNANGNSRKPLAVQAPMEEFDASVRSVRASLCDFKFRKYAHISTCDVYPDCSSPETTREDQMLDPSRQSPYGFHKFLAEQCVRHGAPDWLIFRFGGFIGPGLRKNAIFDILQGGPLFLDPESELQFLHTEKAAEIVLSVAESATSHEIFNLCGRGVVKLSDVAALSPAPVPVKPGSPRAHYEISLEKISRVADIPETRTTVLEFVREELNRRGAAT